jgi:hypothetical protein
MNTYAKHGRGEGDYCYVPQLDTDPSQRGTFNEAQRGQQVRAARRDLAIGGRNDPRKMLGRDFLLTP